MKKKKQKHYIDTCVLIGFLNEEPDKFHDCRDVIQAAEEGIIDLFTSELTAVELIKHGIVHQESTKYPSKRGATQILFG